LGDFLWFSQGFFSDLPIYSRECESKLDIIRLAQERDAAQKEVCLNETGRDDQKTVPARLALVDNGSAENLA
jgi:hypothetical protein